MPATLSASRPERFTVPQQWRRTGERGGGGGPGPGYPAARVRSSPLVWAPSRRLTTDVRLEGTGPGTPAPTPAPLASPSSVLCPFHPRAERREQLDQFHLASSLIFAGFTSPMACRHTEPSGRGLGSAGGQELAGGFGEVEGEGFELDREVDVLETDVAGDLDASGREVQDRLDSGRDQLVGHRLRRFHRDRDDRDLDAAGLHLAAEIAAREDRRQLDLGPDLRRSLIKDGRDAEALTGEAPVVEQRRAEVAEADERHRPLAIEPEDPLQLSFQAGDVVADAADAELAEVGKVLADLRRVEVEAVRQLLRRHGLDAVFLELQQAPGVHRETTDRHLGDLRQASVRPWSHRAARRTPLARGAPVLRYALIVTRN